MYQINNEAIVRVIESYCRMWRIWLEVGDRVFTGESVMSASSTLQSSSQSDDIELGAVCSAQWTLTLNEAEGDFLGKDFALCFYLCDIDRYGSDTLYSDLTPYTLSELGRLTVEQVGRLGEILGAERIPMARLTCVRSKKSGASTELTLADRLYFSDREYTPTVRLPASGKAIEDDICAQLGLANGNSYTSKPYLFDRQSRRLFESDSLRLRASSFDFTIKQVAKGTTMRQMLGYIASMHGQFGFVDRFGRYVLKWYGASVKTLDPNTIDLPTLSEQQNVTTGIVCTVSDSQVLTLGDGSGRVIEFENPYMTRELLASIWFRVGGYAWYTTDLYHRLGDPRFDIGDVVTYEGSEQAYEIPITGLDYSFDGGLSANITAVGISVEEQIEPI